MSVPKTPNLWLTFTRKMKWVLIGSGTTVLLAAANALTDTFNVQQHPWVTMVAPAVGFILGYIPKEPPA